MIDLAPRLDGASRHDAYAERDFRQHLADLAGGERRGCVQIILRRVIACPAKRWCAVNGEIAPSGQWARLT